MSTKAPAPPYDHTRPQLPELKKAKPPANLEILGEPWVSFGEERRRLWTEARKARTAWEATGRLLQEARAADSEALTSAAVNDEPDPGRVNELKALKEIDAAHRKAEGATVAANRALYGVLNALKGPEGDKAIEGLGDTIAKVNKQKQEHIDALQGDIAEIASLEAVITVIEETRKGQLGLIPNPVERPAQVQGMDAIGYLERLRHTGKDDA